MVTTRKIDFARKALNFEFIFASFLRQHFSKELSKELKKLDRKKLLFRSPIKNSNREFFLNKRQVIINACDLRFSGFSLMLNDYSQVENGFSHKQKASQIFCTTGKICFFETSFTKRTSRIEWF